MVSSQALRIERKAEVIDRVAGEEASMVAGCMGGQCSAMTPRA